MTKRLENVSAYIICKDEEGWIEPCIRSLAEFGEIVVVDSGSTDRTLDILRALAGEGFPIRLFEREWPGYAAQKQFALEQCSREWCFCIDADERISDELAAALPAYLAREGFNAWRVELRSYIPGYGYAPDGVRETRLLRVSRNGKARYDLQRLVHEALVVDGEVGRVTGGKLLHRRTLLLGEQMEKEIVYAGLKAEQLFRAGRKPRYLRLIFNPAVYFLRLFFLNRLFLAGWAGFIHCGCGAAYSFMTEAILMQKHLAARMAGTPEPDDIFAGRPVAGTPDQSGGDPALPAQSPS